MTDTPTHTELAPSVARVLTALHRLGEATAAATAAEAGLGYSTTTPKLRTLENAGLAEPTRGGDGPTLWRLTGAGRDAAAQAAAPAASATPAEQAPAAAPANETDPDPVTVAPGQVLDDLAAPLDPDTAAPDGDPDTDAAAAHEHTTTDGQPGDEAAHRVGDGQRPEPEPDATAVEPPEGEPGDESNGSPHGEVAPATGASGDDLPTGAAQPPAPTDTADRVVSPPAVSGRDTAAGTTAMDDTIAATTAAATNRRVAGSLRGAILDILEAHPDQQYRVSELCKLIDRANEGTGAKKASAGAVHNAAMKLVETGTAILAVEKPVTFALAQSDA
ncbi:MarR family transcriptional regulator [Planosporangium sp. 12N6]|uniref:MarR family transcriptional regulator n=1 Tax=Planosporangium spinosum TaxID=3402278 RepID=UPI003CEBAD29